MTDVSGPYFELQTCTKYLPFKFLHSSSYWNRVSYTEHLPLSVVTSYIAHSSPAVIIAAAQSQMLRYRINPRNANALDNIHRLIKVA
jgi:hypothetical protein